MGYDMWWVQNFNTLCKMNSSLDFIQPQDDTQQLRIDYGLEDVWVLNPPMIAVVRDSPTDITPNPATYTKLVVALIRTQLCLVEGELVRKDAKYNVLCADSSVWQEIVQ